MNKKVYFAGSIRGGRSDAALYRRMIDYIGRTDTVLTEHVGDLNKSAFERGPGHDEAIYAADTAMLREADLVIAECTTPSLGVGYELAYAERFLKPCFIFYDRSRTSLSAMLGGDPYFKVFPYSDPEEIFPILDRILG